MIYDLVPPDSEILRTKLPEFDFANPPCDVIELSNSLVETMKHYTGIGLSANQVGLPYRVFCMDAPTPFVCFNPRVVLSDPEEILMEEGCLSFPNLIVKVSRPRHIKVRFATPNSVVTTQTFTGMTARVFQHELQHLDGGYFFDGVGRMKMDKAMQFARKHGSDYSQLGLMKRATA